MLYVNCFCKAHIYKYNCDYCSTMLLAALSALSVLHCPSVADSNQDGNCPWLKQPWPKCSNAEMIRDPKGMGSKMPCVENISDIYGQAKKWHVTATSQDIFTFLPRIFHSYWNEPISRWDYPEKTTWHNHKQNLACRSCDSFGLVLIVHKM